MLSIGLYEETERTIIPYNVKSHKNSQMQRIKIKKIINESIIIDLPIV